MMPLELLETIYNLIINQKPDGVKRVFEPGKPLGPFAQNLPAVVIFTGRPAMRREPINEDQRRVIYRAEVHVFTADPLERAEERSRGRYDQLYPMISDLADILWNHRHMDNNAAELTKMEIYDYGPRHGWIEVEYESIE